MAKYKLTDDEQTILEEVFNLAQKMVDLQIDDDTAMELQEVLNTTAELFGITQTEVVVTDNEDGSYTIALEPEEVGPAKNTWTPTVISNDNPPDKP